MVRAPRIALVGCGAIARSFHLPALVRHPAIAEKLVLVDRVADRAAALGSEFGVDEVASDHRQTLDRVDGAIVAVPPEAHARIARDYLEAGVPVLCEKPLATSSEDARLLLELARKADVALAVNHTRRLFPALQKARQLVESGTLGELRRVEIHDGTPLDWPLASGSSFGIGGTGRGVLQDIGSHVLDTVCWWLGSRPSIRRYVDDSRGGSEAVARVEFELDGCAGVAHLSWLSKLSNDFRIRGEKAELHGETYDWTHVTLRNPARGRREKIRLRPDAPNFLAVRYRMVDNFIDVLRGSSTPLVPAADAVSSIEMIEECYRRREPLEMPWLDPAEIDHALR